MRSRCLYGVLILATWAMGCGTSPAQSHAARTSQVSSYRAPGHLCAASTPLRSSRHERSDFVVDEYVSDEELLVDARMNREGAVSLDSQGARTGYIIARLGISAGVDIVIKGRGAEVPIFGFYDAEDVEWRHFIRMLAASAGMLALDVEGVLYVLDPHEAAEFQRQINRREAMQPPPITRPFSHRAARTLAPALAHTLLGCEDDLTLVPKRDMMLWRARPEAHSFLVEVLAQIEDIPSGEHRSWPISSSRRELHGVADPRMPSCDLSATILSWKMIEDGSVLGRHLYDLAMNTETPLIVGCGGMTHIYRSWSEDGEQEEDLARKLLSAVGLRSIQNFYTTSAIAAAYALDEATLQKPPAHTFMALSVRQAPLLAEILGAHFPELSPSLATDSVIFLRGEAARVDAARQFALNLDAQR